MSCPHSTAIGSTPLTCSLCLQIIPKKVVISKAGEVIVDGVNTGRLSDINRAKQKEETQLTAPQKKRVCGNCGLPGHNRATCKKEQTDEPSLN